jgi:hypothetical protein
MENEKERNPNPDKRVIDTTDPTPKTLIGPDCPTHAQILAVVNNTANSVETVIVLTHLLQEPSCNDCNCLSTLNAGIKAQRRFIQDEATRIMEGYYYHGSKERAQKTIDVNNEHFRRLEALVAKAKNTADKTN